MRIRKSVERWFEIPGDLDKARLKIKHLRPGEIADIFDEVFIQDTNYKKGEGGKLEPVFAVKTNRKLQRELILKKTIVDWENFYDKEDKLMECTSENIIRASREIEGFDDLVTEFREKLVEDIKQEEEAQRKNLPSSASESAK